MEGFKNGKIPVDFSDYISPIDVEVTMKQEMDLENYIFKVIKSYNIKVDKNELIKALQYDRNQFNKGYDAGYRDGYDRGYNAARIANTREVESNE